MPLPHYYSNLAPFREVFLEGRPILTYHHVGQCRRGVRLKGLYLSPKLFARQMKELQAAGFSTGRFQSVTSPRANTERRVFLTFDDGFKDVFENALPIMQQHQLSCMLFLVSDLVGKTNEWQQPMGDIVEPLMDNTQVREWLAAGQEIGSHTRTHTRLSQLSREVAREEIAASKKSLEDRFGVAIEHFCYPYGDWNDVARDLVQEAGYQTACTTQPGVNTDTTPRFELRRFTARYRSRNLKAIWSRLRAWKG
jgi:peptidoglycan/xylan/chitin deacetylase (PgdA/CDA1 family)